MLQTEVIKVLTSEQAELIPVYREKWRTIALLKGSIDRDRAAASVKEVYQIMGLSVPAIHFVESPLIALKYFDLNYWGSQIVNFESAIEQNLKKQIDSRLWMLLRRELYESLHESLWTAIGRRIYSKLQQDGFLELWQDLNCKDERPFAPTQLYFNPAQDIVPIEFLAATGSLFDYCYSILNCSGQELWEAYQLLIMNCGWLLTYESVYIICDRPYILSLDNQQRLHGEGQPAIQFADGFGIYAYQGVELPEKYARLHPSHWRSQWLLEEKNAELKRILIQGIGYDRICQEFNAIELDRWQQYRLLKIDSNVDVEPVYLLTMTCPSTGHPHALRVPPDMKSAKEAIRWVNWDIDPSEFQIQT